jgi:hypothetical protein
MADIIFLGVTTFFFMTAIFSSTVVIVRYIHAIVNKISYQGYAAFIAAISWGVVFFYMNYPN